MQNINKHGVDVSKVTESDIITFVTPIQESVTGVVVRVCGRTLGSPIYHVWTDAYGMKIATGISITQHTSKTPLSTILLAQEKHNEFFPDKKFHLA